MYSSVFNCFVILMYYILYLYNVLCHVTRIVFIGVVIWSPSMAAGLSEYSQSFSSKFPPLNLENHLQLIFSAMASSVLLFIQHFFLPRNNKKKKHQIEIFKIYKLHMSHTEAHMKYNFTGYAYLS